MNRSHKALVVLCIGMAIGILLLLLKLIEVMLAELETGNLPNVVFSILVLLLGLFATLYILGSAHYEATKCPSRNS